LAEIGPWVLDLREKGMSLAATTAMGFDSRILAL